MWPSSSSCLLLLFFSGISAIPFLYSAPRALASLASSASASASSAKSSALPDGNISDLRKSARLETEDDDFFKDAVEPDQEIGTEAANSGSGSFLQAKINKIIKKIRFITSLTSGGERSESDLQDDAFQKEQDEFDKEFELDNSNKAQLLLSNTGYKYPKPSAKVVNDENSEGLTPGAVGVFFMELLGSIIGLAYGAAAQISATTTTTQASVS